MDYSWFITILKTIVVLIIVIILANITLKILNKQMNKQSRIIKIIEKINISNNSALGIVKICGVYYLMSFTEKDNTILKELKTEEVEEAIEEMKHDEGFTDLKEKANLYFGMRKKS